ncbi:MAG: hypothetical protein IJ229_08720, partial [Clostridia bacterium]|nr:hypothetical protein [Clostridia bacterium]
GVFQKKKQGFTDILIVQHTAPPGKRDGRVYSPERQKILCISLTVVYVHVIIRPSSIPFEDIRGAQTRSRSVKIGQINATDGKGNAPKGPSPKRSLGLRSKRTSAVTGRNAGGALITAKAVFVRRSLSAAFLV